MQNMVDEKLQFFGNSEDIGKTIAPFKIRFLTEHEMAQPSNLPFPTTSEIPHIAEKRENHIYEFKAAETEIRDITKEIAAFANTKRGGDYFLQN